MNIYTMPPFFVWLKSEDSQVNINVNPNWLLDSITSENRLIEQNGENFSAIVYTVIASRRSDYYTWNVLMPSIAMAVLVLGTFFMPFGPDRSMFCITLVLTMNIFQQALTSKLPVTAEVIPYVRVTTVQVILGIMITIESSFVWWIAAKDRRVAVPQWIRIIVPALRKRAKEKREKLEREGLLSARKAAKALEAREAGGSLIKIPSMNQSLNSRTQESVTIEDAGVTLTGGDNFIIWGEWIEVAQIVDIGFLILIVTCMITMPVFFYRYKAMTAYFTNR